MDRSRLKVLLACCTGIGVCTLILVTGPEPLEAGLPESRLSVSVGQLKRTVVPRTVKAFGTLAPRQTLQLTTQVPGEITWVSDSLAAGSPVDEGDLLFRIEERDYAIAVASAEAGYAQAQTKVDLERGQSEFARQGWESWQKTIGEERPARPLALREPQQAEAVALVKAARAELDRANLALERTSVRAPWPASVIQTNAVVGQVLSVGEVTATLFPLDFGVVELQVPAKTVRLLDAGIDRVELWPVHDFSTPPAIGVFEGIVRNLTDDTRLATVRVRIDEPLKYEGWAYGMHLEARILTTEQRNVALIPADLIVSGNLIWVYRNGQARRHQVHPIENAGMTVSIEDNFSEGDALILERPIGLFDGADVEVAGT
jgi:RND family efflux transporter MFP subunit